MFFTCRGRAIIVFSIYLEIWTHDFQFSRCLRVFRIIEAATWADARSKDLGPIGATSETVTSELSRRIDLCTVVSASLSTACGRAGGRMPPPPSSRASGQRLANRVPCMLNAAECTRVRLCNQYSRLGRGSMAALEARAVMHLRLLVQTNHET